MQIPEEYSIQLSSDMSWELMNVIKKPNASIRLLIKDAFMIMNNEETVM
jgi:hypothetical protein